eukprot:TRINITY_DN3908_c0_g2_i2.p1 TRINITY_DN3908_c0_g2~~TRINITY_DN3908_c0_g2_i2.p1  ORF type:complete len:384 (+),score=68.87 TRINITY_DN3908_c0_g2_i2:53-1204(+)
MIRRPPRSTQSRSSAASDVYKRQIYDSRGFDFKDISLFYIIFYVSTSLASLFLGNIADKYGRKRLCTINGVLYLLVCLCRLLPYKPLIILSCIMRGASDVILYSSYDAWFVSEFERKNLPCDYTKSFYEGLYHNDAIISIIITFVSSFICKTFGVNAIILSSGLLAFTSSCIIAFTWRENSPQNKSEKDTQLLEKPSFLSKRFVSFFIIHALLYAILQNFIYMWPKLLAKLNAKPDLGILFCCFMSSMYFGSSLFKILCECLYISQENIMSIAYTLGTIAFALLYVFPNSLVITIFAYLVFEISIGVLLPAFSVVRRKYFPKKYYSQYLGLLKLPSTLINVASIFFLDDMQKISFNEMFSIYSLISNGALTFFSHKVASRKLA